MLGDSISPIDDSHVSYSQDTGATERPKSYVMKLLVDRFNKINSELSNVREKKDNNPSTDVYLKIKEEQLTQIKKQIEYLKDKLSSYREKI